MQPLIEITDLKKTYRMGETEVHALDGVSLSIFPGEFVAIMGASGSGKSTLMHILGLLDVPDAGSYHLQGRDIAGMNEDELAALRGRTVGFVFQQFNLLARTPAVENAGLPMLYSEGVPPERPAELLKEVGLGDRLDHKPSQLSGGQQQRVAIARSLVNDPSILMADEPTGNLDTKSSVEIMEHLVKLNLSGITVVLVTHEEDIAKFARRVIRMRDGKIISDQVTAPTPVSQSAKAVVEPPAPRTSAIRLVRDAANYFHQALRALATNKVRAFLSTLGILIGVWAVVAMLALGAGMKRSMENSFASLGTNLLMVSPGAFRRGPVVMSQGAVTRMTVDDAEDIRRRVDHAVRVAAEVNGAAQVTGNGKNWSTRVTGAQAEWAQMRNSIPTWGRFFTDNDDRARARVADIGLTVSRNLFGTQNPIGDYIKINRVSFKVIGLLPEKGSNGWQDQDDLVVIPCATAMHRLLGKEYVDMIDVEVDDPKNAAQATQQITDLIVKRHHITDDKLDSFNVRNMADMQATMNSMIGGFSAFLLVVAAISLLVGGIGIMNIMLVSVTERTREIGLRKALGARQRDILSQFLIESLFISLLGGMLGLGLGAFTVLMVTILMNWAVIITAGSVGLSLAFSGLVGLVFGIWPAWKASKLNPIEALRYE